MPDTATATPTETAHETSEVRVNQIKEHIVEIVSDSGEGAQRCGEIFAAVSAKMGNSIWTVEIIPAEIEPPPRNAAGASGNRIRVGSFKITNSGDEADLVVAFNEQALMGRVSSNNLKKGATILLESMWRTHADKGIVNEYTETYDQLIADGYNVVEIPMEVETLKYVSNPRRGKNMFVLGMLCFIYQRDLETARKQIAYTFRKKTKKVIDSNVELLDAGYEWASQNIKFRYDIPSLGVTGQQIVTNGNTAIGMGVVAAGIEICAMYPITPATSASHYLSEAFEEAGGVVHQAEDEIAAAGVAIGASYAGKCAVTITSGPGMALKTEFMALAVKAEIPLVLVNVQRGGPSTGLPTKVEQGDLLAAIFGTPGDTPKIVLAPATIEDCFYSMITARKIAETFRTLVIVLSDTNLATGQQPYARPEFKEEWIAPPIDLGPVPEGFEPYGWDENTGLSRRALPGQPGGTFTASSFTQDRLAKISKSMSDAQEATRARSLKIAAFQKTLKAPTVYGDDEGGDLLIVGWGSTKGAIEEAIDRARAGGLKVSGLHLKFLHPMASGIKEIMQRFKKVMTVEINYSDPKNGYVTEDDRRYSQLAWLLRARYLVDVDCWSRVYGQPLKPGEIEAMIREQALLKD